jgi:hypothetical protein
VKIKFVPFDERARTLDLEPISANRILPDWFKNTDKYSSGNYKSNKFLDYVKSKMEMTYKNCTPFLDALTAGYIVRLSSTIIITIEKNEDGDEYPRVNWNVSSELADTLKPIAFDTLPISNDLYSTGFRWINNWKIVTPRNYSLLITHPNNRLDLPFHTLTGLVDTDKHPNPILFPFFLKKGFEGMIEAGTPIAQIIPIKREKWHSIISDEYCSKFSDDIVKQDFLGTYKKRFWSKKIYK